jgi:geranylgeranyl diphosphate synthase type II
MAGELKELLQTSATRTEQFLKDYIAGLGESPAKLTESMEYSLYGPGKRIRPALALLCCRAVRTDGRDAAALPPAAAVEMIHCFSLIHDDLPAMDNDDLRRGRPTNHKVYGDALAILAGDALNTMAFDLLARSVPDAKLAVRLIQELSFATGPEGMIGGQVLDTCYPQESRSGNVQGTLEGLQRIHRMKTGALIKGACRMGARAGGATPRQLELIDAYGRAIGLAFQIVDDILDVTASAEELGKKTGKDAAIGKLTYPGLLGMEASKKHLAAQVAVTDQVARDLGPAATLLAELSYMMAERTH